MRLLPELFFLKSIKQGNIAVMGGSFNPPHLGHLYISNKIINLLKLNFLLWVITPLNPFKTAENILPLDKRVRLCKNFIKNNFNIRISLLELYLKNNYTYNTLSYLRKILNPKVNLFWIMGEDLLYSFHKFYKWQDIIKLANIVVVSRGGNNTFLSLNQNFPQIMQNLGIYPKLSYNNLNNLPNWYFFNLPKMDISSTNIRNKRNYKYE